MTQGDGAGAVNSKAVSSKAVSGEPDARVTIVVDGANVVGSRPDGWWRDRAGAAVRLHDDLAVLAERGRHGIPAAGLAGESAASGHGQPAAGRADGTAGDDADGTANGALIPVTILLVLEGKARAAVPRIAERARAARAGRSNGATSGGRDDRVDGEVQVVAAPGSGDDEIVRQAQQHAGHCIVVTADRELRRRCLAAGARVTGPSWLYGLLGA